MDLLTKLPFPFDTSGPETEAQAGVWSGHGLKPALTDENICKDERILAEELRSYCTQFGKERTSSLAKSADVLFRLGQLYLKKSEQATGILQKISYIRSYALLTAARVRFEVLGDIEKINEVRGACRLFSGTLMKSLGVFHDEFSLLDVSEAQYKRVILMRDEVKQFLQQNFKRVQKREAKPESLQKLEKLADNMSLSPNDVEKIISGDQDTEESNIVKDVKTLNNEMTSCYIKIMRDIASECLRILGNAPCKFCIVGLGSLARGEVTLYSDFEHVLLVEEGIDSQSSYQDILEYFRWFSVVFQIIVIGFGETFIPSVTIKSLNDAYSGDPKKYWFYDSYTPPGIAFDGMVPHSCNIPLGRQQATERRTHIVELIQTPQNMAKYLSYDEHLKNGYYLDEVLKQTCLVYGDKETYDCFVEERQRVLDLRMPEIVEYFQQMVVKNTNRFVRNSGVAMVDLTTFDSKGLFYRKLTIGLGFLARVYKIRSDSSFDIIEQLRNIGHFKRPILNKLNYGFAVACELRVKLYCRRGRQTHGVTLEEMVDLVGAEATFACKDLVRYLQNSATLHTRVSNDRECVLLLEDQHNYHTSPSVQKWLVDLLHRGNHRDIISLNQKLQPLMKGDSEMDVVLFKCHFKMGDDALKDKERNFHYKKAEDCYRRVMRCSSLNESYKMVCSVAMGLLYKKLKQYSECWDVVESFFQLYSTCDNRDVYYREVVDAYTLFHDCMFAGMDPEFAIVHLPTYPNLNSFGLDCDYIQRHFRLSAKCRFHLCDDGVRNEVASLVQDIKRDVRKLLNPTDLLVKIINMQVMQWWLMDAVKTIDVVEEIPIACFNQFELAKIEGSNLASLKLLCLLRAGKMKKALGKACIIASKQELHGLCLKLLVSGIWRQIVLSPEFTRRCPAIVVISWIAYLACVLKRLDLFCSCSAPQTFWTTALTWSAVDSFSRGYGEQTAYAANCSLDFAFLLLAEFIRSDKHFLQRMHFGD